jgi:hypothetical protein
MILKLLAWFEIYPVLYYLVALTAVFAFTALAIRRDSGATERRTLEYALLASVWLVLFAWRWPTFFWECPMNPDEGWWPAGALKATADFAPWRGFDGTTSGPLNGYVLTLPLLVGAHISFFSARIVGLFFITGTISALYYAAKWMYGAGAARLSIIPPVLFLSLARDWNFLHFSTELFPIVLTTVALAAATYLAGGTHSKSTRFLACIVAGVFVGSAGFAKLQATPIALAIFVFVIVAIVFAPGRSRKEKGIEAIVTTCALFVVPATIGLSLWLTGEWQDAIISYLKASSSYISRQFAGLGFLFQTAAEYTAFLVGSLIVIVIGVPVLVYQRSLSARALWMSAASLAFLLVCLFAIYASRYGSVHYLLFSVVPISLVVANVLGLLRESRFWKEHNTLIVSFYVALFLVPSLSLSVASGPSPLLKEITFNSQWIGSLQAIAIARYAHPGDRVAIWGWAPHFYVQTKTIMATRDAQTSQQILPGPHQKYFRERFMSDLRANAPVVFVDAVAPEFGVHVYTDRATQGYEIFPELAEFVRDYYTLKEEVRGVRIFVLKDK